MGSDRKSGDLVEEFRVSRRKDPGNLDVTQKVVFAICEPSASSVREAIIAARPLSGPHDLKRTGIESCHITSGMGVANVDLGQLMAWQCNASDGLYQATQVEFFTEEAQACVVLRSLEICWRAASPVGVNIHCIFSRNLPL